VTKAEAAPAAEPVSLLSPRHRRLTAGIVSVILLIAFEAMAVATVMPRAVAQLGGLSWYAWAFSGYLVTSLFAMVVAGELSDADGPRSSLLIGVSLFGAGLLVSGTAANMPIFVVGRGLQGLGGGAVIVAIYVVVARAYDEAARPRVFAALSAAWVLPSIVGPAVAGWVADVLSWRWVFLAIPVLVFPSVLAIWPELTALRGGSGTRRPGRKRSALLAASGVAVLQYAGQRLDLISIALVVIGVAMLIPGLRPLLPAGTLRFARGLPSAIALRGVLAGAFFGAEVFLPLMLISERGLSTTAAGLALTGGALGWASGSWFQARSRLRLERYQLVRLGGLLVATAIVGAAVAVFPSVPVWVAAVGWVIGGMGMGMAMPSVGLLTLSLSPEAEQGANSAALQVSDSVFSTVFIGLAGAVYALATRQPGPDRWAFWVIDAVMCALAVLGATMGGRLRTAVSAGDTPG